MFLKTVRLAAEWAWTRMGIAARYEDPNQGYIEAGWPQHGNTGQTCVVFPNGGQIFGWRIDTTVRSITHEVLFAIVITNPRGEHDVFASWTHSAHREVEYMREPFVATKFHEALMLGETGISVPIGSTVWVYAYGWGQWYGPPSPVHATVMEMQGHLFVDDTVIYSLQSNIPQTFVEKDI